MFLSCFFYYRSFFRAMVFIAAFFFFFFLILLRVYILDHFLVIKISRFLRKQNKFVTNNSLFIRAFLPRIIGTKKSFVLMKYLSCK